MIQPTKQIATFPKTPNQAPDHTDQANQDLYDALDKASIQTWKDGSKTAYITSPGARVSLSAPIVDAAIVSTKSGNRYLLGCSFAPARPGDAKQAAASWTIIKLPERNNATGAYEKKPGEQSAYWTGPVHEDSDYPEVTIGWQISGNPGGDTSPVESITIPADDLVSNWGTDYSPARNPNDPVISRLQHDIQNAPNNGRINPFEANAELAGKVKARSLGKLAIYNAGIVQP